MGKKLDIRKKYLLQLLLLFIPEGMETKVIFKISFPVSENHKRIQVKDQPLIVSIQALRRGHGQLGDKFPFHPSSMSLSPSLPLTLSQ